MILGKPTIIVDKYVDEEYDMCTPLAGDREVSRYVHWRDSSGSDCLVDSENRLAQTSRTLSLKTCIHR
jgi:hypothetical protein